MNAKSRFPMTIRLMDQKSSEHKLNQRRYGWRMAKRFYRSGDKANGRIFAAWARIHKGDTL